MWTWTRLNSLTRTPLVIINALLIALFFLFFKLFIYSSVERLNVRRLLVPEFKYRINQVCSSVRMLVRLDQLWAHKTKWPFNPELYQRRHGRVTSEAEVTHRVSVLTWRDDCCNWPGPNSHCGGALTTNGANVCRPIRLNSDYTQANVALP